MSQGKKPIALILRTLTRTEQNYSTNEKEMLAIVWALKKLRNYLYGLTSNTTIYTDHQSLIFSISEDNPNSKLKRWKNFIEEYGAKIKYIKGDLNVVADALSRHLNVTTNDSIHSLESSSSIRIKDVSAPLNQFKTQIVIKKM